MEPLKNQYNPAYIKRLAAVLTDCHPSFPANAFEARVLAEPWEELELKQRMRRISESLRATLPPDFPTALAILNEAAKEFGGFTAMFFPEFVELYGQDHWELSLEALAWMTRFSSSEFAVRPFIKQDPKRLMALMNQWASHENYHVRRLASEGCRPRLPWAMALPEFKKDPSLILPILEKLKTDPEDYVRRSVANNLNDISKDHPQLLLDLARRWLGSNEFTDWIVKHACRTLLKAGNPEAMLLFGYGVPAAVRVENLCATPAQLNIGENLNFNFEIKLDQAQKLRLEYAVYFLRSNGTHGRKVFKISETGFGAGTTQVHRKQAFANLSTRKHYPGRHRLEILINGVALAETAFQLSG